jgi:bifunctional UDP-N-acetylglucosamine pyrophosphorylase/glucosamine-1-phosphate N-acetyltransferase
MSERTCLTVVLAAGEGTRMRASRPKVLHTIGGRALISHVLASVREVGGAVAVVVGPSQDAVAAGVQAEVPNAEIFVQSERRGTAHAVFTARAALSRGFDDVLVVFADTPLIRPDTLLRLRKALAEGAAVVVLGFEAADPTGYGRLLTQNGRLIAIREEKDASPAEGAIRLCNAGLMGLRGDLALGIIDRIGAVNAKGEFYLTDAVEIARKLGHAAVAIETAEDEVRGINTQAQLAEAEELLQRRLRAAALEAGVTMVAPHTVFLAADTKLGRDVVLEPFVVFGPGVVVEDGAVIRAFSRLEKMRVPGNTVAGPFVQNEAKHSESVKG